MAQTFTLELGDKTMENIEKLQKALGAKDLAEVFIRSLDGDGHGPHLGAGGLHDLRQRGVVAGKGSRLLQASKTPASPGSGSKMNTACIEGGLYEAVFSLILDQIRPFPYYPGTKSIRRNMADRFLSPPTLLMELRRGALQSRCRPCLDVMIGREQKGKILWQRFQQ